MSWAWNIPFIVQGIAIFIDEFYFHRKRRLPTWEIVGHPVDSFFFFLCLSFPLGFNFSATSLKGYLALSLFSCLLITKDEWVHQAHCTGGENWLHAVLFILHPIVLLETLFFWISLNSPMWIAQGLEFMGLPRISPELAQFFLYLQAFGTGAFFVYQMILHKVIHNGGRASYD